MMKKFILVFYCLLAVFIKSCSMYDISVDIEVTTKNLPDSVKVYITGNDDQLGNWQPNSIELVKTEEGKWVRTFSFPKNKKLEFKFTLGSWESEALLNDGTVPSNHSFQVFNDTSVSFNINFWADKVKSKIEGQVTGNVKYHRNFQGKGLKLRDIIVWLPPDYDSIPDKRYAVLYMHDGQNIFDPLTSSFQIDWQIDECADSLIRKELIEPIIIVGIYNTIDRDDEYSEDELGILYLNFITDSLKPFIDSNYRTKSDRSNTVNGGASLGGLISFILAWERQDVFSKAICFSPAFKIEKYNFVDNVNSYIGRKKDLKFYIYNGDNELDSRLQTGVDEMLNALKSKGYYANGDFYFFKGIYTQHSERDWAKNVWRALIFMFGTENGRSLL